MTKDLQDPGLVGTTSAETAEAAEGEVRSENAQEADADPLPQRPLMADKGAALLQEIHGTGFTACIFGVSVALISASAIAEGKEPGGAPEEEMPMPIALRASAGLGGGNSGPAVGFAASLDKRVGEHVWAGVTGGSSANSSLFSASPSSSTLLFAGASVRGDTQGGSVVTGSHFFAALGLGVADGRRRTSDGDCGFLLLDDGNRICSTNTRGGLGLYAGASAGALYDWRHAFTGAELRADGMIGATELGSMGSITLSWVLGLKVW